MTQGVIAERSRLSKRTVRHALSMLTDAGLVRERVSVRDARRRVYSPLPLDGEPEVTEAATGP